MVNGVSEIDDSRFFLAKDGKTNAKDELHATIDAFFTDTRNDENSTLCRFPARLDWLTHKLNIRTLKQPSCKEYEKTLERMDPQSATIIFPAAHINSPASMFGHTFLRINSSYNSKLLSYAINYAADADPNKENGFSFALKGLFGGYYGKYSLLPYYDKLKEYRDTENRDIFEYDLNLSKSEVLQMFRHIWELNNIQSRYYFFTENCSYNILWLLEVARPSLHLREHFIYQVTPLETIHVMNEEKLITTKEYRASKRTKLLTYENLLKKQYFHMPQNIIDSKITLQSIVDDTSIKKQQKMYILEAAIELLEYNYKKNDMDKETYLTLFHDISKTRASLGKGKIINIKTPPNPLDGHRAFRVTAALGSKDDQFTAFLGLRPTYHDLSDSDYGFLRGTQIEFFDLLLSSSNKQTKVEHATILSITSLTQNSTFIHGFSWRTKFGWDNNYLDKKTDFYATLGGGLSYGNRFGYLYMMIDPLVYLSDTSACGIGSSLGLSVDKYSFMNTNVELTKRFYDNGKNQWIFNAKQSFRTSQNSQLSLQYDYADKQYLNKSENENIYKVLLNYYF